MKPNIIRRHPVRLHLYRPPMDGRTAACLAETVGGIGQGLRYRGRRHPSQSCRCQNSDVSSLPIASSRPLPPGQSDVEHAQEENRAEESWRLPVQICGVCDLGCAATMECRQ